MNCLRCKRGCLSGMRRGLCPACYQVLNQRVRKKKTTWALLEAAGKCLTAQRRGAALAKILGKLYAVKRK